MIELLKSDSVVIVEGKYDKIKLDGIIDAFIIPTNGFGVFKDKEKRELIRKIGLKHGIIILTDSDSAGMQIRSFIKSFCGAAENSPGAQRKCWGISDNFHEIPSRRFLLYLRAERSGKAKGFPVSCFS